ncbi:MerR family transcriptional regulator [Kitasatospora aureofaciens]|uniref:MerR family transcriptional regulator n=1 Tax=Kitasatospora aureofaciens TaxID=1894 RepID=UPI00068E62FC|nr:MerR family transcriptional regulator [Kitasatospora aureofaciens]HJD83663.1 MerR family transcriptional regulator [Kitasatospora aureofaciens]
MLIAVDKARAAADDRKREYRVEELAEAAGITTRTLRFYRERKLLQPPRKEGRIAWYGEEHLSRLRMIGELLERGHTLGGIAELIGAGESGRDVAGLIGLEAAIVAPWSDETPVRLDWEELKAAFGDQLTEENTAEAIAQGYISIEEDGITHVSRRLMDATTELVAEGVPLAAVLDASRRTREYVDAIAEIFIEVVSEHLLSALSGDTPLPPGEAARLTERILRVRPLARTVADAQFALAMDRRVQAEYAELLRQRREYGSEA